MEQRDLYAVGANGKGKLERESGSREVMGEPPFKGVPLKG
jgi:hypothetical protein